MVFIEMTDLSEKNLNAFAELEKALEKLRYGSVSVWFQIHDGKIVSLQGNQFQQIRFKEGQNADAVSVVLAEIKKAHKTKKNGNLTVTLKFSNGDIRFVYLQRNYLKRY